LSGSKRKEKYCEESNMSRRIRDQLQNVAKTEKIGVA
jgi:hypothetical protein